MADWSDAACDEYIYAATERDANGENQPRNIDWCKQDSANEQSDVLWPAAPQKSQYVNMSQSPTRQSPRRKPAADGQSESLSEELRADVLSASILIHKGSRYSRTLSNFTFTEKTTLSPVSSTRSMLPERPKSPVKVLPDLALAYPPTIQVHINNGRVEDDVLGRIHKGVERAVRYGIFPKSLKDSLRQHISDLDFEDDRMFADDSSWNINAEVLLEKVIEIQKNAQYCEDYKRPEACWGDDVVRPILVFAHQAAGCGKDVRIDNVMSTRIWPSNLVQRFAAGNLIPVDTKKVDYAIFYASPPDRKRRIALQLQPIPEPCNLNQTSRPEHATSVNLFSIEIKTFVSADDPLLQLAIWASAGLQAITNVFRQDLPAAETIPPAFMMSMRGAECKIAYMKLESLETDSFLRKLYGDCQIGSATTVTGIFQIISAFKVLLPQSKRLYNEFWDESLPAL
ncbi:hypothetical protein B0O99DRAFT_646378 [Bisporella sp. PMI_857]|nr:hypothetical protein B0O99DRAFT_646378 [Bisporella sp. PMI_857]